MHSPEELRPPAPPALKSEQYKKSYLTSACLCVRNCVRVCVWIDDNPTGGGD